MQSVIAKTVTRTLSAEQSKAGVETVISSEMYYRIGAGWVAQIDSASKITVEEQLGKWADVAYANLSDNEFPKIIEM